jgi:hypothetical protein
MERKKNNKKQNSIFTINENTCINDILVSYLIYDFTQELVDIIIFECGKFLISKKYFTKEMLDNFSVSFLISSDGSSINIYGNNLLSSLWIIDVFPKNFKFLIDKTIYEDSDFKYKFYTKNKNLEITKIEKKYDERNVGKK